MYFFLPPPFITLKKYKIKILLWFGDSSLACVISLYLSFSDLCGPAAVWSSLWWIEPSAHFSMAHRVKQQWMDEAEAWSVQQRGELCSASSCSKHQQISSLRGLNASTLPWRHTRLEQHSLLQNFIGHLRSYWVKDSVFLSLVTPLNTFSWCILFDFNWHSTAALLDNVLFRGICQLTGMNAAFSRS